MPVAVWEIWTGRCFLGPGDVGYDDYLIVETQPEAAGAAQLELLVCSAADKPIMAGSIRNDRKWTTQN